MPPAAGVGLSRRKADDFAGRSYACSGRLPSSWTDIFNVETLYSTNDLPVENYCPAMLFDDNSIRKAIPPVLN
jgi:hypothetical protein